MVDRMIRAAKADIELYEEVEHSPSLTQEAYTIVGIVAAVSAIGGIIVGLATMDNSTTAILSGIWQGVSVFLGYFVWSYLTFFIGTNVFKGTADYGELQRTIGYSMTPQVLSFIPIVGLVTGLWSLYLGFVAVRQALDVDNSKAALTIVIAFVIQIVIFTIIGVVLGVGAFGVASLTGG